MGIINEVLTKCLTYNVVIGYGDARMNHHPVGDATNYEQPARRTSVASWME